MTAGTCPNYIPAMHGKARNLYIIDGPYVYENPCVRKALTTDSVAWAIGSGWRKYHPLNCAILLKSGATLLIIAT